MLFDEYLEDIKVYRQTEATGWSEPTWELIITIQGRFEPIQGSEALLQNQNFSDVQEMFLTDYSNREYIKAGDGLEDSTGLQRRIAGEPEDWKWDLISPHVAAMCRRAQWIVP